MFELGLKYDAVIGWMYATSGWALAADERHSTLDWWIAGACAINAVLSFAIAKMKS